MMSQSQPPSELQKKEVVNFLVDFLSDLIVTVILKYKTQTAKDNK
jgi:hypothetical protein